MVSGSGSQSECCVGCSNRSTPAPSPSSPPVPSLTRRPLFQSTESPQRNPSDNCYSCGRKGHWAQECPNRSPRKSQPGSSSSSAMNAADLPRIRCPCSRGVCPVRTSSTEKNPGRRFFACPAGKSPLSGGRCNFFLWCDDVADFRVPKCPCGAGSCSLLRESSGANAGQWYFACRVKKGHGACLFLQWVDPEQNNLMNKYLRKSSGHCSSQSHQLVNAVNSNDSGNTENLDSEIEIEFLTTDNFESSSNSPTMIVDLKQDVHNEVQGNLVLRDVHSCRPKKRKISRISSALSKSLNYDQQTEFSWQTYALKKTLNEGIHVSGWFGRLVYLPSRCLNICNFPSLDPVPHLKEVEMYDSEVSNSLIHNFSSYEFHIQLSRTSPKDRASSRALCEFSRPKNCTSSVCERYEDRLSVCILGSFGQALLRILESLSPADHKKMLDVAEVTLDTLHRMSIDYEPFSEVVKEFIHCSSKLAEFEGSVDKELCSQELIDIYGGKKARYENASHLHKEALGALKTSENHLKSLGEEVSHVKGMLCELEKQLFSCEAETLELQDQVAVRYEEMVEAEGSMEAACKIMEEALELEQQRETAMQAAQAALERARRVIKFI